jgi:hypothetical protein
LGREAGNVERRASDAITRKLANAKSSKRKSVGIGGVEFEGFIGGRAES